MDNKGYDGFYIGWAKKLPKGLKNFLIVVSLLLAGAFAGTAFSFVTLQDDPGEGAFRFDLGRQTVVGVLKSQPYPVIHVQPSDKYPNGHSIMLAGQGKRGVIDKAAKLDGKLVKLSGVLLKRGELDMIQVAGRIREVEEAHDVPAVAVESLGKWRLNGEICDGKCYAGAMRPGTGLAHKACANLCLIGGTPPVFVSSGSVQGQSFFLMADKNGIRLDKKLYDLTAILIEAQGEIEKHGDLMVFKIDLDSAKVK